MAPTKKEKSVGNSNSPALSRKNSLVQHSFDLAQLNNRFAGYIQRVRELETENAHLSKELENCRQSSEQDLTYIKELYQEELTVAKNSLDEVSKERAKLEIDTKSLFDEKEDLAKKLDDKTKKLLECERHISTLENNRATWQQEYNNAIMGKKKCIEKNEELEKELSKMKSLLDDTIKSLKEETIRRVDLENRNQSLVEELSLRNQIHIQELQISRSQMDISQIDKTLCEKYETKLEQSLQELRDQYEKGLEENCRENEELWGTKLKYLENQLERQTEKANKAKVFADEFKDKMANLNRKITTLEGEKEVLKNRNKDLERLIEATNVKHSCTVDKLQGELVQMSEDFAKLAAENQELTNTKIRLDFEIATYRKLLESEEDRMRLTPVRRSETLETTPPRVPKGKKRKNQGTLDNVEVSEIDWQDNQTTQFFSEGEVDNEDDSAIVFDEEIQEKCSIM